MAIFPEKMDRLNPEDTSGSLRRVENYINYMRERMEFATGNLSRSVGDSGTATAEVLQLLLNLTSAMSSMQSTLAGMKGELDDTSTAVDQMRESVNTASQDAASAKTAAETATQTVAGMQDTVSSLQDQHKTGSYDGNGNSATRTVNVGVGTALMVYDGSGIMAIVTAAGMHYMSSTTAPTYKDAAVAAFANGTLTLNTASYINADGRTYYYQVL